MTISKETTNKCKELVKTLMSSGKSREEICLALIQNFPINFSHAGAMKFIVHVEQENKNG
jgi:hypothetical protein